MRHCSQCNETKPYTDFYYSYRAKDNCSVYCKECSKRLKREHTQKDPERTKELYRKQTLKKLYNMTPETYDLLLHNQNGLCAICNKPGQIFKDDQRFALYVDHDHKTGKIRGLLCHRCNTILGNAGDSVEVLLKCIDYLKNNY